MNELEITMRLAELEHRVAHLYASLGSQIPPVPEMSRDVPPDVVQLARDGNVIGAIKRYRDATGAGLAEAKEAVERALRR